LGLSAPSLRAMHLNATGLEVKKPPFFLSISAA
jgi:hypothetical protein